MSLGSRWGRGWAVYVVACHVLCVHQNDEPFRSSFSMRTQRLLTSAWVLYVPIDFRFEAKLSKSSVQRRWSSANFSCRLYHHMFISWFLSKSLDKSIRKCFRSNPVSRQSYPEDSAATGKKRRFLPFRYNLNNVERQYRKKDKFCTWHETKEDVFHSVVVVFESAGKLRKLTVERWTAPLFLSLWLCSRCRATIKESPAKKNEDEKFL